MYNFVLFRLLQVAGSTADDFFCGNLELLSNKLKLSSNVAGVTLLSFGNGKEL